MKTRFVKTLVAAALAVAITGCQPARNDGRSAPNSAGVETAVDSLKANVEVQGTVTIEGSSTVGPISSDIAEAFKAQYPNITVTVGIEGTGKGFEAFAKGKLDICDASRPIKAEEFGAVTSNGIRFMEIPVAYDGLTLVVHKDNHWAGKLTLDELKKIFLDGGVKSWNEVRSDWPNEPIAFFSPDTGSGTFDYFKEVIAGKNGNLRSDMSVSENDNVLVTGVAGNKNAVGFFGVSYYEQNKDKLNSVSIVNPKTKEAVFPTSENIESGEYAPFGRPLFIYVNAASIKRPEVKLFVKYYLENVPKRVAKINSVALARELYERAKETLAKKVTGTYFLDADKKSKSGSLAEIYQGSPSLGSK